MRNLNDLKIRPVLLLVLIVAAPVVLLSWAGMRIARDERELIEQRMQRLLLDRLSDIDRSIAEYFAGVEREMIELTTIDQFDPESLRRRIRREGRIHQLFVIAADGTLVHPDPRQRLNESEEEFLVQTSEILKNQDLLRAAEVNSDNNTEPDTSGRVSAPVASNWYGWYWSRGLNLLYWQQRPSGHIVGVTLERSRWIADLIAALPDTPFEETDTAVDRGGSLTRLVDSNSNTIYQWGQLTDVEDSTPTSELALSEPITSWRLQYFLPPDQAPPAGVTGGFQLILGMTAVSVALGALAFFFYREYARDMQDAERRVSFVNQVSHELRTPLTNIQMYADLLGSELEQLPDESVDSCQSRLQVIQTESQRLGRLISNVLTFASQQRQCLELKHQPVRIDDIVQSVVDRFRPSLQQHGIELELKLEANRLVLADADAVEQILGNLLNNIEKYATEGRWACITTSQQADQSLLEVADRGPGVPADLVPMVFEPFQRGSDRLSRAAGTGIGLTIVRELARLHGGDAIHLPGEPGARFQVTLMTPPANEPADTVSSGDG